MGGTRQSGIAASTYHRLKQELGLATPTRVYDLYQMLAEIERPVMERFGADVVGLNRPDVAFGIVNQDWKPWRLFDGTPVEVPGGFQPVVEPGGDLVIMRGDEPIARMPKDGFYFDRVEKFPGAAHVDLADYQPPLLPTRCSTIIGPRPKPCIKTRISRSSHRWDRRTSCSMGWARAISRCG